MTVLSDKAMLTVLTISQWTATKLDKQVTDKANRDHGAQSDAGRYNKQLLPKEALAEIVRIAGAARTYHYQVTLPWLDNGARVLPAKLYRDYRDNMDRMKVEFAAAVDTFLTKYEAYVHASKRRLGDMFSESEYPSRDMIERKYAFDVALMPCPDSSDFRVDVGEAALNQIKADMDKRSADALATVTRDVFERVADVLGSMVERLKEFKPGTETVRASGVFRDSLVTNVQRLAELMPALNITGDKRIDRLADILSTLGSVSPDTLREDTDKREKTATAAQSILDTVNEFLA